MKIIIDSREQNPFIFPAEVETEPETLTSGDYSSEIKKIVKSSILSLVSQSQIKKDQKNAILSLVSLSQRGKFFQMYHKTT